MATQFLFFFFFFKITRFRKFRTDEIQFKGHLVRQKEEEELVENFFLSSRTMFTRQINILRVTARRNTFMFWQVRGNCVYFVAAERSERRKVQLHVEMSSAGRVNQLKPRFTAVNFPFFRSPAARQSIMPSGLFALIDRSVSSAHSTTVTAVVSWFFQ